MLFGQPVETPAWARHATAKFFESYFKSPPMTIPFKRLHPSAKPPTCAHPGADAGYYLYALPTDGRPLMPGERRVFLTGIALAIPPGYYGRVAPRSGLAVRHGLDTLAGVVDSSYRGDVSVVLINHGQDPVWIGGGERIGQLIIERCYEAEFVDVADGELEQSDRGAAGFGPTGTGTTGS